MDDPDGVAFRENAVDYDVIVGGNGVVALCAENRVLAEGKLAWHLLSARGSVCTNAPSEPLCVSGVPFAEAQPLLPKAVRLFAPLAYRQSERE